MSDPFTVIVNPESGFGKHWIKSGREYTTFEDVDPQTLTRSLRVIVLCPEHAKEPNLSVIMQLKRTDAIGVPLVFGTYKGYHMMSNRFVTNSTEVWGDFVAAYVTHSRSYSSRFCLGKPMFVPLALSGDLAEETGTYWFVGGRKDRDFRISWDALHGRHSVFISDKLPHFPNRDFTAVNRARVSLATYKAELAKAKAVVVPVKPGDHPHGHSDVVRALLAGKPVVVTRGASCDDYVEHNVNGYLADYSAESFRAGIEYVECHYDELSKNVLKCRHCYTYEAYNDSLIAHIFSLL